MPRTPTKDTSENKENQVPLSSQKRQTTSKVSVLSDTTNKDNTKKSNQSTKSRETATKQEAPSKKRKSMDSPSDDKANDSKASPPKKTKTSKKEPKEPVPDVTDIELKGDFEGRAPIYLTASDIRRQLNGFLSRGGVTQAKFCKAANAASGEHISGRQLNTFRDNGKKHPGGGSVAGADSPVFYAAWCYFEKLRIKEGKKKSKHQEEMEKVHGSKGMSRHGLKHILVMREESIEYDKFGRLLIDGRVCD